MKKQKSNKKLLYYLFFIILIIPAPVFCGSFYKSNEWLIQECKKESLNKNEVQGRVLWLKKCAEKQLTRYGDLRHHDEFQYYSDKEKINLLTEKWINQSGRKEKFLKYPILQHISTYNTDFVPGNSPDDPCIKIPDNFEVIGICKSKID